MKIKLTKIKENFSKLLKKFWQNLFLVMLLLLLLDLILGGLLFYKYYLKIDKETAPAPFALKINEVLLNQFSSEWVRREEVFKAAEEKQYPNPFRSRAPLEKPSEAEEPLESEE